MHRYFYKNLLTHEPGSADSLFEKTTSGSKFKVKDHITFHLYISTAPCGDGALFSPRDATSAVCNVDGDHDPTFTNKGQGVLRTKMEGGNTAFAFR